jgi:small subunit ribosomal protein S18
MAHQSQNKKNKRKVKVIRNTNCTLCDNGVEAVSYLDVYRLKKFISRKGKIISRFRTGNCSKHQRMVTISIKRARILALLPFSLND